MFTAEVDARGSDSRRRETQEQRENPVGAERIAAGEAAARRAELDRRREWRLFRRLRWALRGDRK
jgi:hypothetical protein